MLKSLEKITSGGAALFGNFINRRGQWGNQMHVQSVTRD